MHSFQTSPAILLLHRLDSNWLKRTPKYLKWTGRCVVTDMWICQWQIILKIFWDTITWKKFNIPIVIPSSLRLTRPPLLFGMEISAMYIHSAIADNETANPKISRPNRTDARFWDKATTNAPIVKRSALRIIVVLRPNRSTNIPLKMQISN